MNEADFGSYANDNIPYVTGDSTEGVINSFENVSIKLFEWFADNQAKANKDKCHLLISVSENTVINVDGKSICKKLLGVNVEYKVKFNKHLDSIFKKVSRKVDALSRILPYMNFEKDIY